MTWTFLETISEKVLKEDSVFIVATKRSSLDKCRLPMGIRLFVSAGHTEADITKVAMSVKRVAASVLC
uniref:Serine C-palmitoyltransferase n=1 Tax=Arundo donax TaxID=35708 RepID=A0A0A9CDG0_ARUDO